MSASTPCNLSQETLDRRNWIDVDQRCIAKLPGGTVCGRLFTEHKQLNPPTIDMDISNGAKLRLTLQRLGIWSDNARSPAMVFPPTMEMPRKGRTEAIQLIWKTLATELSSPTTRPPLLYLQSTAGMGKTFLLREFASKHINDIPMELQEFAKSVVFLNISFSGIMPIYLDMTCFSNNATDRQSILIFLRILFSEFITQSCDWLTFHSVFIQHLHPQTCWLSLRKALKELLDERYHGVAHRILLIDDITRAHHFSDGWSETFKYCLIQETSGLLSEYKVFDLCLMSTLSKELLDRGKRSSGPAFTRLIPCVQLSLLTQEQSLELFLHYLQQYQMKVLDNNLIELNDGLVPLAHMLAQLCGGHGRSIACVVRSIEQHLTASPTSIQAIINDAITSTCIGDYQISWPVIRAVLTARVVNCYEEVPGLQGITYDSLMVKGALVASLKEDDTLVPFMPELYLHYWMNHTLQSSERDSNSIEWKVAECLQYALKPRWVYSSQVVAIAVLHWERVMRYDPINRHKPTRLIQTIGEWFSDGCISSHMSSKLRSIKVNITQPLDLTRIESSAPFNLSALAPSTVYVMDKQSPFFDYVEVIDITSTVRKKNNDKLFIFHKVVQYCNNLANPITATNDPDLVTMIHTCYNGCKDITDENNLFLVVIYAWHNDRRTCSVTAESLPPNCVLIDQQDAMKKRFGIFIPNFIENVSHLPMYIQQA